ncbi:MAG: hypothetical protein AVDCRST_MAG11-1896, partial [uncultured Gemmatimonadaceae bacterium]
MATHTEHGHGGHHGPHVSDRTPAFVGLVGGGAIIGAILYGVVVWTNTQFEGHTREKAPVAAAGAAAGAAPAGGA